MGLTRYSGSSNGTRSLARSPRLPERELARVLPREKPHQARIDEQFLPADLDFLQYTGARELLEIDGGRLPLGNAGLDDVPDAAVGLDEDELDQLPAVHPGYLRPHVLCSLVHQLFNGTDAFRGPASGLVHRAQPVA